MIAAQLAGVATLLIHQQLLPRRDVRGRMAPILEVVPVDEPLRTTIRNLESQKLANACRAAAHANGGVTLRDSVRRLASTGRVDPEIAFSLLTSDDMTTVANEEAL
jgi:Tfp pilus assembly pilus retraction ATPase PilT